MISSSSLLRKEQEERDLDDDLRTACYIHDVETVRNLLSIDTNIIVSGKIPIIIDRTDMNGRTQLMNCGSDPQTEDLKKVDYDCYDIAILLKKNGANLLHVDNKKWDILSMAVTKGFIKFSKYLIEIGNVPIDHKDNDDRTALMKAAGLGSENIYNMLLSKGANILEKDKNGQTVIHFLTQLATTNNSYIPFYKRAIKNIINKKDKNEQINLNNIIDNDGRNPLMYAAIANDLETIKILIEIGKCDPRYVTDNYGIKATSMSNKLEIQEYLSQVVVNLVEVEHREWLRTTKYKNEF
jgi:ankyrin repeat protein